MILVQKQSVANWLLAEYLATSPAAQAILLREAVWLQTADGTIKENS